MMDAKNYLQRVRFADERISSLIWEALRLRRNIRILEQSKEAPIGVRLTGILGKLWMTEANLHFEIDTLVDFRNEVREAIGKLKNPEERLVLRLRYLQNMNWEQIAGVLETNEKTVTDLHKKALLQLEVPDRSVIRRKENLT